VIEDFDSVATHCLDPQSEAERGSVAVSKAVVESPATGAVTPPMRGRSHIVSSQRGNQGKT
jgi:hypothetical protein